jgi:hypothetical protein
LAESTSQTDGDLLNRYLLDRNDVAFDHKSCQDPFILRRAGRASAQTWGSTTGPGGASNPSVWTINPEAAQGLTTAVDGPILGTREARRAPGQHQEDRLEGILSIVLSAQNPAAHALYHAPMPPDQLSDSVIVAAGGEAVEQLGISRLCHRLRPIGPGEMAKDTGETGSDHRHYSGVRCSLLPL